MDARIYLITFLTIMSRVVSDLPKLKMNDGNEMPAIALGTFLGFENGFIKSNNNELRNAVCQAIDLGYRHIDTASIYDTEKEVGEAVQMKIEEGYITREDMFITTKVWNTNHEREKVVTSLKKQLESLGMTYVDLYLMHWPIGLNVNNTFSDVDFMETWRGLEDTKTLGLAKSIGICNFNKTQLERLLREGTIKPAALQIEVHLNNVEKELVEFSQSENIVVMGYSPFGSLVNRPGLKFDEHLNKNAELLAIAKDYGKTVPQIALRWLYQRHVVPLPKTIKQSRLKENIDIFDFNLTEAEMNLISSCDKGIRFTEPSFWQEHPYYPFKKIENPVPFPVELLS